MQDIQKPKTETEAIQMLHQYNDDLLPKKFGTIGKIWVALLCSVILIGLYCYVQQLRYGLSITGMRDTVSWGIYISNFVFFVAISLVGSLIAAILRLVNANWRAPLTRISEVIAVASIMFAGIIIIVDMGRPDRVLNMFIYGRIQSPIIWDVIVVMTYMTISVLMLYFPLIPGIAFCRDRLTNVPKWQKKMYRILSLGWNNTPAQYKIVKRAMAILSVLVIPVALSIHTVTSWLFETTYRPGWDSTNFGAYFVSGAFMVGTASVILAMSVFHKFYHRYDKYITDNHFDKMGKLLVLISLVYLYFTINEYIIPAYKMKGEEAKHLHELFVGQYAPMFWSVQIFGMIIPIIVLVFKQGRRPVPMFIMAVFVIVGAWFKRFLIVIPTLLHPFLPMQEIPEAYKHYIPTFAEWAITCGSLAGALLVITLFVRYFPIISIWEVAEERGIPSHTIYEHLNEKESTPSTEKSSVPVGNIRALAVLFLFFSPLLWKLLPSPLGEGLGVRWGEAFAQSEKLPVTMNLSYKIADGVKSVKVQVSRKENKKNIPANNVIVNLFLNEVKKHDTATGLGWVSNLNTNEEGEGIFQFTDDFYKKTTALHEYTFIANMNSDPRYEDAQEEITLKDAAINITFAQEDSVKKVTATLTEWKDSADKIPVAETEVKLYIKRTFSLLPFGEEGLSTNEDGEVAGELPLDIPGNTNGTLTLVAKIEDNETYGTVEVSKEIPWSVLPKTNVETKRTLWSTGRNAPLPLVIASCSIITVIWGILFYLFFLLYKISKVGRQHK